MGKHGESTKDKVIYKKQCKYIGSIAVAQRNVDDRQQFINEKFAEMKEVVKGIVVVLVITDEGVKVLNENESNVKMAHGVTRIILSTCQPEQKLFAYVAKSMTSERRTIVQAHMFKTKRSSHTKEINTYLSKAFKLAYTKATINRNQQEKLFEKDAVENKTQRGGKRWAKQEIAHGHTNAAHAQLAKRKITPQGNQNLPVLTNQNQPAPTNQQKYPSSNNSQAQFDAYLLPTDGTKSQYQSEDHMLHIDGTQSTRHANDVYELPINKIPQIYQDLSTNHSDIYLLPEDSTTNQNQCEDHTLHTDGYECPWDNVPKYQDLSTDQNAVQPIGGTQLTKHAGKIVPYDYVHRQYQNALTEGSDQSSMNKTSITQKETVRQSSILTLEYETGGATGEVQKRSHNFVSPAQRFSTVDNEQRFATSESPFEGYVNVVDKNSIDEMYDNTRDSQFELTEEDILKDAEWYQAGFSREIAESVLADRPIGSFLVRKSVSQPDCHVMTVKLPTSIKPAGIGNFLIAVENNMFRLKGFKPTFKSLTDLIAHYGSVQEDIPVQLRLGNDNMLCTRKKRIDESDCSDEDDDYDDTHAYDDPDYQYFTCADDMIKELDKIS